MELGTRKTRFRVVASLCPAGFKPAGALGASALLTSIYIASPFPDFTWAHFGSHPIGLDGNFLFRFV